MTNILWAHSPSGGEVKIPILGLCGEFESGKTLFGLTIAPGVHPAGHKFAGKARTCIVDIEKSSENYEGSQLGFDRIDLPQVIMSNPAKKAFSAIDLWEEFRKVVLAIPDGRYDVLAVDPISDLDDGLVNYVRDNPEKFGLTKAKIEKTFSLLWVTVKEEWNRLILALSTKCKSFVFTTHMKDEYIGTTKTGKRIARGKETLGKLATLYFELQRKPVGGVVPSVPTAMRMKGRICDTFFNAETGEITMVELLPKVIEKCTPGKIRELIAKPVVESPVYTEDHLTDDMRLAFQIELETKRSEANNAELELADRREKLLAGLSIVAADSSDEQGDNRVPKTESKAVTLPVPPADTKHVKPASVVAPVAGPIPPPPPTSDVGVTTDSPPFEVPPEGVSTVSPKVAETRTPDGEPKSAMHDGLAEFPPPNIPPREELLKEIKTLRDNGYFTKEELAEALKLYEVSKVSEMNDSRLASLYRHVVLVREIVDETTKRNIPRSQLEDFTRDGKQAGFFVSGIALKETILNFIRKQPISSGN